MTAIRGRDRGVWRRPVLGLHTRRPDRRIDKAALADAMQLLDQARTAFDVWVQGAGQVRQAFADAEAALQNLFAMELEIDVEAILADQGA